MATSRGDGYVVCRKGRLSVATRGGSAARKPRVSTRRADADWTDEAFVAPTRADTFIGPVDLAGDAATSGPTPSGPSPA